MNRHLNYPQVSTVCLYLCLEKMTTRLNSFLQNLLQRASGEHLKAAGHILEFCAEQKISQNTPCSTNNMSAQRRICKSSAFAKPAAKNAIIPFSHFIKKLPYLRWLVTKAAVYLQYPITTRTNGLTITSNICVHNTFILRRPDYSKLAWFI